MTYILLCEWCNEPFCGTCNPACAHAPMCPECDHEHGCKECRDDNRGERDLNHLRGK